MPEIASFVRRLFQLVFVLLPSRSVIFFHGLVKLIRRDSLDHGIKDLTFSLDLSGNVCNEFVDDGHGNDVFAVNPFVLVLCANSKYPQLQLFSICIST